MGQPAQEDPYLPEYDPRHGGGYGDGFDAYQAEPYPPAQESWPGYASDYGYGHAGAYEPGVGAGYEGGYGDGHAPGYDPGPWYPESPDALDAVGGAVGGADPGHAYPETWGYGQQGRLYDPGPWPSEGYEQGGYQPGGPEETRLINPITEQGFPGAAAGWPTGVAGDPTGHEDPEGARSEEPPVPHPEAGSPRGRHSPRRAGRDLPAAVGVGVVLAGAVLASLYFNKVAFVGLAAVAVVLAVWELSNALAARDLHSPVVPLGVGSVAMLAAAYAGGPEALAVTLALTVVAVLLWRLAEGVEGAVRDVSAGVFTALYVPFLAGFAMLLLTPDDGPRRVTILILITICSDTGGYVTGVLFGRRPMAPSLSPKKSWEGFAGSLVVTMAGSAAAVYLLLEGAWWEGALVGAAGALSATFGDLGESMIKRDLGVKDMGTLLPGHGGVMDRIDSLLLTAPVVWALLRLLVPSG